ncbi:MAG: diguanylate cyclase [Acidimicrobiales bacterium]|jgi:diguanylate cyclase (GGDEF)-like protein/PAS domain S-box-containing protein|nr:diguanylate cyclase [Acidimicrobiales bacterium]
MRDETSPADRPGPTLEPERLQLALQTFATEFLLYITPRGELVATDRSFPLGYDPADRLGHHIGEHIHPDDLPHLFDVIERARATAGFEETVRARARDADGNWRLFEATVLDAGRHPDLQGAVVRVREVDGHAPPVAVAADAAAASAAHEAAERFHSLAEALPLGILSADARGYVVFCNDAAQHIFNLPADALVGRGWEDAVARDDRVAVQAAVREVVTTGSTQHLPFRIDTGAQPRWVQGRWVPMGDRRRRTGWVLTLEDVTERRRAESQLAWQATHDALTGLPNRMLLEDRLRQAVARLRRDVRTVTVLFIDLDQFKDVNDRYGHRTGDQVLVEIAGRLPTALRSVDTVARLGGDEFVAVCEDLPAEDLPDVVERIATVVRVPVLVASSAVEVGTSIGVATTTDPEAGFTDLIAWADQAMYREKLERRGGGAQARS